MKIHEFIADTGLSPADVYRSEWINLHLLKILYASIPMNTNGARRITKTHGPNIVQVNSDIAQAQLIYLCDKNLIPEHEDATIINPSALGRRDHQVNGDLAYWGEIEYNTFWGAIIAGIHPDHIAGYYEAIYTSKVVNWDVYKNTSLATEIRDSEFNKFCDLVYTSLPQQKSPVKLLLQCLDAGGSYGSRFEAEMAKRLGIQRMKVKINPNATGLAAFISSTNVEAEFSALLKMPEYLEANIANMHTDNVLEVVEA